MPDKVIPTFDEFKAKGSSTDIPTLEQFKAGIPPNPSDSIPAAKAPVPAGLQGPAPSRWSRAVTNLPYSVVNSLENTVKGPQMGGDDAFHPPTDGMSNFQRIGKFLEHPIDNTLDWAADDPVAAAQQAVMLGKGGIEAAPEAANATKAGVAVAKGAARGAKEGLTMPVQLPGHSYAAQAARVLGVENIPAPVAGAILGKYGTQMTGISHFLPGSEYAAAAIGAASPIVKQAYIRGKQALADYHASQLPKPPAEGRPLSPGGIPTGPDLSGGGTPADILAAELAKRRAINAAPSVEQTPAEPTAPPPPPDPFAPSRQELDAAAQGTFKVKSFELLPEGVQNTIRDAIRKANVKKAASEAPPEAAAPAAQQPEVAPQENIPSPVANEVAEPAQPEPVSTPEPQTAPPAPPEPQQAPVPEPVAPAQSEVSPVQNPMSGQANPIPKDFGPTELSDMPVRSGHAQIRSSTVHSVGYDPETGHPEIHFKKPFPNGGLYRYPNLPQEELLRAVQEAPSFGAWTREVLRANPEWTKGYQKVSTEENPPLLGGAPVAAPAPAENTPPISAQPASNPVSPLLGKNPEGVPDNPHPKAVYTVPTSHLQVDAPRFQYKAGMGKGGASDALRDVQKYDTQQGGVLSVWRDPANGKDYIVNGHHRLELAQRAGEPNVRVQYIDAPTAADARLKGAILNIGEGQGTAIDAAKVFRDGGIGPEELGKYGIALTAAKAKAGMALANLDPHLFSKVVNGEFPIERAQIIGEGVKGMEDQRALYDLIKKRESSGKSMTDGQIGEMIRLQTEAPRVEESQESLFGTQEMSRSLLPEKAEVSSYVRQQLSDEKKLFKAVANGSAAEKLGAAGNVIKAEENAKVAITAAQAQAIYDKLSTSAGAINNALDEAAQAIAKGSNATNAKTIAYQKIKSELFKQAKSLAGESGVSSGPP